MDISQGVEFEDPKLFLEWGLTKKEFIHRFTEEQKVDDTRSLSVGEGQIFGVVFQVRAFFEKGRFEGLELWNRGMEGSDFEALLRKYFGPPKEALHQPPWESRGLWEVGEITVTFCVALLDERHPRSEIRIYRNKDMIWFR